MALSDRSAFFIGLPRRVQLTPQQPWCLVLAIAAEGSMKIALALRTVANLEVQGTLVILCIDLDMQQELDPVVQKLPFCIAALTPCLLLHVLVLCASLLGKQKRGLQRRLSSERPLRRLPGGH